MEREYLDRGLESKRTLNADISTRTRNARATQVSSRDKSKKGKDNHSAMESSKAGYGAHASCQPYVSKKFQSFLNSKAPKNL
jgi:hypothetical protein